MNDDQHERFEELLDEALGENIRCRDAGLVTQHPARVPLGPFAVGAMVPATRGARACGRRICGSGLNPCLERWRKAVSSHSIRVGVAQDNFVAGEGLPAIMQSCRWRDARTVIRYGAKLAMKSGASARLAKRFSA